MHTQQSASVRVACTGAALLLGGGGSALAQTGPELTRFVGGWPYSTMSTLTGDRAGDFMFICEGGVITFVDLRGITRTSDPAVMNPFYEASRVKRVRTGKLGVRAAGLALDPDADLLTDTDVPPDGLSSNDREDVLYIAGAQLGLWAMRAETTDSDTTWNSVVRLDDAGVFDSGVQDSHRFCNQLEFASVDGQRYLVATFGEKDGGSRLRFYDLDAVRDRLDWAPSSPPGALQPDGTGYELAATWEVVLGERPGFPFVNAGDTYSEAFPLGIAVDHPPATPTNCAALYVAMGPHGIVRLTPVVDPLTSLVVDWTVTWGPVFGDGSHYALQPQNGHLYWNLDYRNLARSVEFDDLDRSEPPIFTDVAVQHDVIGSGTVMRYLYCTVDHLNWVRFDLTQNWSPSMPINHHEGEGIAIERKPFWYGSNGLLPLSSYGGWKEMVRATDLPPLDGTPAGANRMDTTFARRIEIVHPPSSAATHKFIVVTASGHPFLGSSLPMAPRATYSYNFQALGGINLITAGHLSGYSLESTTIVYTTQVLVNLTRNGLGYVKSGGLSLFVPPDQTTTGGVETLKFFHNNQAEDGVSPPAGQERDLLNESCLTFYDVVNPPAGIGAPVFIRDSTAYDHKGRYNNGIGYCISDPRILTSSHNDGLPFMDGILWTRPSGSELIVGPAVAPPVPANADDRRMECGIVCPQNNQWQTPDNEPATGDIVFHYMTGLGTAAPLGGGTATQGWSILRNIVDQDPQPLPVSVAEDWLRVFDLPLDRYERQPRKGYLSAATTEDAFTAWATPLAGTGDPVDYLFFTAGGTSEGVIVCDRTELLRRALEIGLPMGSPPQNGTHALLSFPDSSLVANQFPLDTHPEWDPIPSATSPGAISSKWWQTGLEHQGISLAWAPTLVRYPEEVSGQTLPTEEWILAVPCFTLANPHGVQPIQGLAGTVDVTDPPLGNVDADAVFANTWFAPQNPAVTAEVNYMMSQYSHGLVQFWRFTDLPKDADDVPNGRSDLPFIVLPHAGTCAWRIETVVVGADESSQVLLFVADFGGHVYVYDITDVPDLPRAATGLPDSYRLATWTAPSGVIDSLHSNVRALAVDKFDDDLVYAYAGVPGHGIEILKLKRTPGTDSWSFDGATARIETPGDVYGLTIRPANPALGLTKTLLVSDAFGGLRMYGEELP